MRFLYSAGLENLAGVSLKPQKAEYESLVAFQLPIKPLIVMIHLAQAWFWRFLQVLKRRSWLTIFFMKKKWKVMLIALKTMYAITMKIM